MSKIKKHLQEEFEDWEREQLKQLHSLNTAWRHLILNVLAYLSISIIEYFLAEISNSQTLRADAFNNIGCIIFRTDNVKFFYYCPSFIFSIFAAK